MTKGRSRKKRSGNHTSKIIIAVLLVLAAVLFVIIRIKQAPKEPGPTTGPAVTETPTESASQPPETTTETEPVTETEPEPEWRYYIDKSGKEQRYLLEEGAALREFEWNIPRTDENGNPVFEKTDDSFPDYEMIRGIDVSKEQGTIDWYQVRDARCDFVILCADERFEENYRGAYALGMKIGAYYRSNAATEEEAREDAREFLAYLEGKELDLFAAYVPEDMTDGQLFQESETPRTRIAEAFCDTVETAGFQPAIYASMFSEAERYDMSELAGKYAFWYSEFAGTPVTPYPFCCWQYCLTGGIRGVTGPVNLDVLLLRPYEEKEDEKSIYSYTQFYEEAYQMTTWVNKRVSAAGWNGDWAKIQAAGREFMMFGCGVCCLSNSVSTLTDRVVDPEEMYYALKDQTNYYPESGVGAVSWEYLKSMCGYYGLNMDLRRKPSDYESFVKEIQASPTAIVLVDGNNDKRLWWYTDGHYVNIWKYDPATGTVFVTDPSTHFNRLRVKLADIYNALKTASSYQYGVISNSR
ncbi:MAG: hypothetical protein IJR62_05370 [Lachnospiraceae bacterium]|nr:hypothetical protein [Lachnospiraceae bacterium]